MCAADIDLMDMVRMDIVSRVRPVRAAAAALVCATLALLPASASAGVAYGDIVAYAMTFPVVGDHYFADTFGAPRAHARGHEGQDIMADKGTPVVAAAAGTIRLVNWTGRSHLDPERCCSVVVDHDDGWQSKYLHLTDDSPGTDDGKGWGIAAGIVPGAEIAAGQLLGWVGDSGNAESTAPHLHFELLDSKGIHVNARSRPCSSRGETRLRHRGDGLPGSACCVPDRKARRSRCCKRSSANSATTWGLSMASSDRRLPAASGRISPTASSASMGSLAPRRLAN